MARIGCLAERNRSASIESLERPYDVDWTREPKSPQALNFSHHRTVWKMAFVPMRLKPESGANRIKSADDAYSFMVHMRLSDRNQPHWQVARAAAAAEGWLEESNQ